MFVKEIEEVKNQLAELMVNGLISKWELPYENLLTRRSAAIFFIDPAPMVPPDKIWAFLQKNDNFKYSINEDKKLSALEYKITFSQ